MEEEEVGGVGGWSGKVSVTTSLLLDDASNDGSLIVDVESPGAPPQQDSLLNIYMGGRRLGGVGGGEGGNYSGRRVLGWVQMVRTGRGVWVHLGRPPPILTSLPSPISPRPAS
ncbi:hypothetical protein Pcinc_001872 [Petrolisthes cinctipes]|uniref:Uncharacterized protein n=1 Tax=Petrolisthes cinctipes TaxID=88211 RepID=A0AAE1GQV3_PETCI|nr:hypothetical protein Pcinc_001872 [Petrolisthes cinctipes]